MSTKFVLLAICALATVTALPTDTEKPKVTLLFESLCPGCHSFILYQLIPAYKQLGKYFDFELVPFGNARVSNYNGQQYVQCQHGAEECYGNEAMSCAIKHNPEPATVLNFMQCMLHSRQSTESATQECANQLKLNYNTIKSCIGGQEGSELTAENAKKTDAVRNYTRGFFVPWVLINGKHQDGARSDLVGFLCDYYLKGVQECN